MLEYAGAVLAGFLSFFSPCVLPLLPSYLAMLAGTSAAELRGEAADAPADIPAAVPAEGNQRPSPEYGKLRRRTFLRSLAFSLGFTAVFVVFGIIFSQARFMLSGRGRFWTAGGGVIVILLGINILFDFVSFLNNERRFHIRKRPGTFLSAFLFGAAFGAGWSPCVGPILASILFLAASGPVFKAAALLLLYSAAMALPFILGGLFFSKAELLLRAVKRHLGSIRIVSGVFLIFIGLYMILGDLRGIPGFFARLGYMLSSAAEEGPLAFRFGFSLAYAALGGVLFFVCSRSKRAGGGHKFRPSLGFAILFLVLAILEGCGVISSPRLIASWLLYQGI
ncbi:cytochrome c biogenesis protein CcdA [Treponema sp. OttesenSCG-928-L16]|nr:cytochrome c biogenesis protein CcdA [Treponema sp. OttesenSCG-928-L16]